MPFVLRFELTPQKLARRMLDLEYVGRSEEDAVNQLCLEFSLQKPDLERFVAEHADEMLLLVEESNRKKKAARDKHNARERSRRCNDPAYRLQMAIRAYVGTALKKRYVPKRSKTFDALGWTMADLIAHLTPLLRPGMTWESYGSVWHVDHIRPVSSFNFNVDDPMQVVRECWALSNLQPLFKVENLRKGAKYVAH